jgi:hypothetical protein
MFLAVNVTYLSLGSLYHKFARTGISRPPDMMGERFGHSGVWADEYILKNLNKYTFRSCIANIL